LWLELKTAPLYFVTKNNKAVLYFISRSDTFYAALIQNKNRISERWAQLKIFGETLEKY